MKNLLLIILFTATSFAQVKEEWVRYYDGPADSLDFAEYVKVDAEGNVYVGGTSAGTEPYYDFVLIKYNSLGQEQWVRRVDLSNFDYLRGMTLDQEGNIILTGIIDYLSYPSTVTLKYDPQGELQWQKIFSNANNINFCNAITSDGSGNIYVSGYTNNDNDEEFLTIKYNYSGEQAWVKYYGLQGEDARAHALVVDYLGNIYVTGQTGSSQSTINDYLTIKYNSNGVEQWIKIFEGSNYAWSWGVNLDDATNIYVIGAQYDNDDNAETLILKYNYSGFLVFSQIEYGYELQVGTTTQNGDTYFAANDPNQNISTVIVKYNSEGVKQWEKTYEEPGRAMDMDTDHNGDIYVTGFVEPSGQFSKDIFTVKYSKDGVKQWDIKFGGNANLRDESRRITLDKNQNIYITGYSESRNTVDLDFLTIKYSQALRITEPQAGEKWIAGETDTIKWTGGQAEQFLSIEYSVDDGQTYNLIELAAPADSNYYVWKIPKTILSTKVKIKLTDFQTSTVLAECETFKIKPYVITRVDQNGDYIAYDINIDKWGFSNTVNDVWPRSWFQQFNYQGIDPFTNKDYPQEGFIAFKVAPDSIHPDWVSWVNTFGISACYFNVSVPVYSLTAILRWQYANRLWNGSCFGIAISNALAFQRRNDFLARYPNFPDNFTNPIEVTSGTTVIPVINELFTHQFGNPHVNFRSSVGINKTPNQTLADLKQMLREDNVQVRTIGFLNNGLGGGGHAILGHKVERHPTFEDVYRVFVYDNSNPDSLNAFIEVDTTLNTWQTYYDWITWGGSKWFYLRDPAENYLANSILPKNNKEYQSPFILPEAALQIFIDETESILLTNTQGQSIGYNNNNLITEITDAYPFILDNGSLDPPIGYELENEIYSITIDSILNESFGVAFFNSNKSFGYDRNDALQSQTDRLFYDGGVSAVNPDQQVKNIYLTNIINETTQEKVFLLNELELAQNDSIKIINPDDNTLDLISYGSSKDYQIELNYTSQLGMGRFQNGIIQLGANTTHKLVPNWENYTNLQLTIYVDQGNNGTIDDSIIVQNTVDVEDQGLLLTPNSYNLAQNFPNPFNPSTKISWQSPVGNHQTLKVFDVLGNEVATLVDEFREAGRYEITFDASALASGIYFYKLQAGSFTETKKMILLR